MWLEQLTPLAENPVELRERFGEFLLSPLVAGPPTEDDELRDSLGLRRAG